MNKIKRWLSILLSLVFLTQMIYGINVYAETSSDEPNIYTTKDSTTSSSALSLSVDNNTITPIATNEEQNVSLQDIVLVLDDSGSMSSSQMSTLKEAAIKFSETVLQSNPNNRIGIVYFSKNIIFNFSNDIEAIKANINSVSANGGTPIDTGILSADSMFTNYGTENSVRSMVIMSDGEPDNSSKAKNAFDAVSNKYNIYSVYLGTSVMARAFMEGIQNKGFYNAENIDSLIEQFGKIAESILNPLILDLSHECKYNFMDRQYFIELIVTNPNDSDIHNVKVHLDLPEGVEFEDGGSLNGIEDSLDVTIDMIKAHSDSTKTMLSENDEMVVFYNPFSWNVSIFQEKEDKSYDITAYVSADEIPTMNISDTIFVDGYMGTDESLDILSDTWNFPNYSETPVRVDDEAFEGLLCSFSDNNLKESFRDMRLIAGGGHCYGMSSTVILHKSNLLFNGQILHEIDFENTDARNSIGYYHLTQRLPVIWDDERWNLTSYSSVSEKLQDLANKAHIVKTGANPSLVIIGGEAWSHAIVAYGYEANLQTNIDGKTYNSAILIYDCNHPNYTSYIAINSHINSNYQVVVDDDDFSYLTYSEDDGFYHSEGSFDICGAINDINLINIKSEKNMKKYNNAVMRVKKTSGAKIIENNNEVASFDNNGDFNSVKYVGVPDISASDSGYYNINLNKDACYSYKIDNEDNIYASIIYNDFYEKAESKSAKGISFYNDGKISLNGNTADYELTLTANNGYTSLPWYTVKVNGTNSANNPSLSIVENGYLFEGEELSNIIVTANNDTETKELTFDSDKTSVLITNEEDDLVVKEDTDGDGNYETPIADSDGKVENEKVTETTTIKPSSSSGNSSHSSSNGRGYSIGKTESTTESTTEKTTDVTSNIITDDVKVSIGSTNVIAGDKTYKMDAAPYIQTDSNSTLVPLRFVAVALLGDNVEKADSSKLISWDATTKTATINVNNKVVKFTSGSPYMVIDGKSQLMENNVKAEIKDGRMYIPFRALGKALDVNVTWEAETKTAIYSLK